jgi:hypothetical protein
MRLPVMGERILRLLLNVEFYERVDDELVDDESERGATE